MRNSDSTREGGEEEEEEESAFFFAAGAGPAPDRDPRPGPLLLLRLFGS